MALFTLFSDHVLNNLSLQSFFFAGLVSKKISLYNAMTRTFYHISFWFRHSLNMLAVVIVLVVSSGTYTLAQVPAKPQTGGRQDTAKAPLKFTAKWGPYTDSSKTILSVAKQLLKNELKITDNKGGVYKVISFDFAWRQKEISDDFKTGVPKTIYIYNITEVKNSASIPEAWQKEMQERLQAKEEFLFDDILAQNVKTNKIYRIPSLRILLL